jgi:pyruvate/2-oxoglutarate dehydrogenase complex dihydrolipoamide dehydrogenase (E3) component
MYDLVVIGGGAGGLFLAKAAARVGASVALVERESPGEGGALAACVPSKGLVQAAKHLTRVRNSTRWGVETGPVHVDFAALLASVRQVAHDLAGRASAQSLKQLGVDVYIGPAPFEAYDTLRVDASQTINGHRFVIATGSRPAVPDVPGLTAAGFLDERTIFGLTQLPEHLIVLGSGSVALEFAQSFARLGSRVTVIAESPAILAGHEPQAVEAIVTALSNEGITFVLDAELTQVEVCDGRKVCHYKVRATGASGEVSASDILVAAGRLANVDGLNLEAVGIHGDPQHGIEVDECLQTHSARAFAMGDVLLRHPSASAAEREADVVLHNAVLRLRKKIDYSGLPVVAFTDPELASVGLTEAAVRTDELPHRVYEVPFSDVDRAVIDGHTGGFARVIATPAGKVLGATIVGEDAAMIVQEFVLTIERGLSLRDLWAATPAYPTYAAVARQIAGQYHSGRLETGLVQKALRFLYGFVARGATANGAPASEPTTAPAHHVAAAPEHGH